MLCRFQFGCWLLQSLGGSAQLGGATTSHWSNSCKNGGFPSSIYQISLDKSFVFLKPLFARKVFCDIHTIRFEVKINYSYDLDTMSKILETWETQKGTSPHHLITRSRILEEKELVLAQMKTPQELTLCVSLRLPITSQAEFSPI